MPVLKVKKDGEWVKIGGDGKTGATGATPKLRIGTVTSLSAGSAATASITGTDENPVLNLGIPKGPSGYVALENLEGRTGTLETKVRNIAEDIASLQIEMDDLETMSVMYYSFEPHNHTLNPIDYRFIVGDKAYTIDNLLLNQMPIVSSFKQDKPIAQMQDPVLRIMPDIPISMLTKPITFEALDVNGLSRFRVESTVSVSAVNQYITSYAHTVTFDVYDGPLDIMFEFLEVSQPCWYEYDPALEQEHEQELAEDPHFIHQIYYNYFDKAGIYYIDRHALQFYLRLLMPDEGFSPMVFPNIRILFDEPVTIPAKVVTRSEMEEYVQNLLSTLDKG